MEPVKILNRCSQIFGKMIEICMQRQYPKGYYSDLFWDADWIRQSSQKINGNEVLKQSFYWSINELGTHISESQYELEQIKRAFGNFIALFYVRVLSDDYVEFVEIKDE